MLIEEYRRDKQRRRVFHHRRGRGTQRRGRNRNARTRKRRSLQLRGRRMVRHLRAAFVRRGDLCAHTRARLHHRHPAQAQAPDCDHNPAGNCPDRISISRHGRRTSRTEGSLRLPHAVFGRLQGIRAGEVLLRGVQARHIEDPARRPEVRRDADDTQRGDEIDIPLALRRKILRLDTPGRQPGLQVQLQRQIRRVANDEILPALRHNNDQITSNRRSSKNRTARSLQDRDATMGLCGTDAQCG